MLFNHFIATLCAMRLSEDGHFLTAIPEVNDKLTINSMYPLIVGSKRDGEQPTALNLATPISIARYGCSSW